MSKFYISLDTPHEWVLTDPRGDVIDKGSADELSMVRIPRQVTEIIGVASGQSVTVRSVMVPGKRRVNVEAALPYALEEGLTEDVADLHFTLLSWRPDEAAVTAIASRSRMKAWTNRFNDAAIALDKIVPEYLLLPLHDENSYTISKLADDNVYVRTGLLSGFSMDQSFFEYWLETEQLEGAGLSFTDLEQARSAGELLSQIPGKQVDIRHWDIGSRLADWLRVDKEQKAVSEISLLHGAYTPPHLNRSYRPLKVAACCLLLAAGLFTLSMWRETGEMREREDYIKQEMSALFKSRFPGEPYLGRPRVQVSSLLGAGASDGDQHTFQLLLKSMTNVARQNRASIEEVNFRDSAMTVLCNVDSLAVLDNIRSALQGLGGISAELISSGARDNQVTGRFRLTAAG